MPHALGWSSSEIENKKLDTITSVTTNQVKCVTLIIDVNISNVGRYNFFGNRQIVSTFSQTIINSIESPDTFLSGLNLGSECSDTFKMCHF